MKLKTLLLVTLSTFSLPIESGNPLTQFINWLTPPVNPTELELNTPVGEATIPPSLFGPIVISHDGELAYVVDPDHNVVVPIDIETNTLGDPIQVGMSPSNIDISPDGSMAYVINAGDNTITPIILESHYPTEPIIVDHPIDSIALSNDGNIIYITYSNGTSATLNLLAAPLG